jgi:hypothetical protein
MALTIGKVAKAANVHVEALAPFNWYIPALVGPVLSDLSKLCRLGSRYRRITNDSEVLDLRVVVRQHQISRINRSHVLVELVVAVVLTALWRPHVAASNLMIRRLVLVNPPVLHRPTRTYPASL